MEKTLDIILDSIQNKEKIKDADKICSGIYTTDKHFYTNHSDIFINLDRKIAMLQIFYSTQNKSQSYTMTDVLNSLIENLINDITKDINTLKGALS